MSIKNIADILGISPSTVSLVLNGKDKDVRISEELAAKVRETAKKMNYRPNMAARSLRTKKTKTIGLIVADISNPFFSKLARYIENISAQKDYQVIFGSSDESHTKFQNLCDVFTSKGVDGMIVVPPLGGGDTLRKLVENKTPLVIVDREPENIPINTVMMDNYRASYTLTEHLIGLGSKNIGLVGHNQLFSNVIARYNGYKDALEKNNIVFNDNITKFAELNNFEEDIENLIEDLLKKKVDSILFITSKAGRQALFSLKNRNYLEMLQYASIDLFDDCRLSNINLSCIEQPLDTICEKALAILFNQINDPQYKTVEYITLYPPQIKTLNNRLFSK